MGVHSDIKDYILAKFGRYSAGVVDEIALECDPERYPVEFSERCIDLLSIAFGAEKAKGVVKEYFKYLP